MPASVARAAGGGREVAEATLDAGACRPAAAPARLTARIASCGPPRAALLVLERAPL